MRITCAIIDDEPEARELVRNLLERYFPAFEILGETDNLDDAAKLLDNESLDLVFLDIQLYDRNIFEISDKLSQLQAKIIFITAYNHFALNAFRVNAVDYLLKPITSKDFRESVERVVQRNENDRSEQEKQMIRELGQLRERKLLIHNQDGIHVIPMEQIIRLEADNNYTTFYLVNAQKIVSAKTLKDYDVTLSNFNFIRCHQTHLVNLHHIVKYNNRDGGHLVMSDGDKVPVSQRKRMDVLNQLSGKIL